MIHESKEELEKRERKKDELEMKAVGQAALMEKL